MHTRLSERPILHALIENEYGRFALFLPGFALPTYEFTIPCCMVIAEITLPATMGASLKMGE